MKSLLPTCPAHIEELTLPTSSICTSYTLPSKLIQHFIITIHARVYLTKTVHKQWPSPIRLWNESKDMETETVKIMAKHTETRNNFLSRNERLKELIIFAKTKKVFPFSVSSSHSVECKSLKVKDHMLPALCWAHTNQKISICWIYSLDIQSIMTRPW